MPSTDTHILSTDTRAGIRIPTSSKRYRMTPDGHRILPGHRLGPNEHIDILFIAV